MPLPLPDNLQAADLELYIREDKELVRSGSSGGHYYYSYSPDDDDEDRIDPRFLMRPSAPIFDGHSDGEEEGGNVEFQKPHAPEDGNSALRADMWLEDVPVVDDADFEELLTHQHEISHTRVEQADRVFPSQEGPSRSEHASGSEESGSEDGEGDTLFEVLAFGRHQVGLSFLAYKPEWNEAYEYILQGLTGFFYCPRPRYGPQAISKPKSQARQRNSRMQDPSNTEKERRSHSCSKPPAGGCVQQSRSRANKTAPPLRVRLLSASLQNRAIATRDVLFQHVPPHETTGLMPAKPQHEGSESSVPGEAPLNVWELRAIESLFELERL